MTDDPVKFCEDMAQEWRLLAQRFIVAERPLPPSAHDEVRELFHRALGDGTPLRPHGVGRIKAILTEHGL